MEFTTLVIHPKDSSTDFLKEIYKGRDWNVITEYMDFEELSKVIAFSDRVIMLGHGTANGLLFLREFGGIDYIIDERFSDLLKEKNCVFIWCHADQFVKRHGLSGFYTGMFISEMPEAEMYDVAASEGEIDLSNKLFAVVVRAYIFKPKMCKNIMDSYYSDKLPVVVFNRKRIYKSTGRKCMTENVGIDLRAVWNDFNDLEKGLCD